MPYFQKKRAERSTEIYLINYFTSMFIELVLYYCCCYCCSSFLNKTQNFRKNRNIHRISSPRVTLLCICIAKLRQQL